MDKNMKVIPVLTEFRSKVIEAYNQLPKDLRFLNTPRDLREDEKLALAHLNAAILVLNGMLPGVVDVERLNQAIPVMHTYEYDSVFSE